MFFRDIAKLALKTFYSPLGLSIKALINSKIQNGQNFQNSNGELLIENFDEELDSLLCLANTEPQQLMEIYNIN